MSKDECSGSITEFSGNQQAKASPQYSKSRFIGDGITLKMGVKDYALIIWDTLFKRNNQIPDCPLPSRKVDLSLLKSNGFKKFNSSWLGHSSLIIHVGGYRILTDPVFEDRITPIKLARFHKEIPLDMEEIADVDVVIISHDNFDHLNKYSIEILAPVTKRFLVPLGVGTYLTKWGVNPKKIIELDWWQKFQFDSNLTFIATPARHFSGQERLAGFNTAGHYVTGKGWDGIMPGDPAEVQCSDHHDYRPGGRDRPAAGAGAGCRRLYLQTIQPPGSGCQGKDGFQKGTRRTPGE